MEKKLNSLKLIATLLAITILLGSVMNRKAIENNDCKMPVMDKNASYYYLTDIFPLPNNYYFSLGDIFLFLGAILFITIIFKYPLFIKN
jgi:hypothetical protein